MTDANMRGGDFVRPPLQRSGGGQRLIQIDEETTRPPLQRSGGQRLTKIDDQEGPRPPSTSESHDSARSVVGLSMNTAIVEDEDSPTSVALLLDYNRHGLVVHEWGEMDGQDDNDPPAANGVRPSRRILVEKSNALDETTSGKEADAADEEQSSSGVPPPPLAPDPLSSDDDLYDRQLLGDYSDYQTKVSDKESTRPMSAGEIRSARKGILSRASAANSVLIKQMLPADSDEQISTRSSAIKEAKENKPGGNKITPSVKFKQQSEDILTEGQYYLGISMLVYMYSHLRETCRMGHTRVKMEDIDVNSHHSNAFSGTEKKFLEFTKNAGSIVRVLVDELAHTDDDGEENESMEDDRRSSIMMEAVSATIDEEYQKSITDQFLMWIEDSRVNHLDEATEIMIAEKKRDAARHRWRRLLLATRFAHKLNEGKRPSFEFIPGFDGTLVEVKESPPKYFREGTVMNTLIESGVEVVWFSDMTQNDTVYGICVQREERKVTVVFRGSVNVHNWNMNFKLKTNAYHNPIKQNYPGRTDEISLHTGFALYLMRKRKDTGVSKLTEIFDKVEKIGQELAPDGKYKLSITGHSLGGALATICGFYFAARSRFANLPTIHVWTFAAPRVGTQAFLSAWQHLERTGRIRHARFSVPQDVVPLMPFCNFDKNDFQFYKHVGMRVHLHGTGKIGKWRLERNLDVTYPLHHDWPSNIRRALTNNILANLNTISGFNDNHTLTEYQKRLHFALTYRKALGSGAFFSDRKRYRLKTLDEYYHIRANITSRGIAPEILEQSKQRAFSTDQAWVLVMSLALLLLITWVCLITFMFTGDSIGATKAEF